MIISWVQDFLGPGFEPWLDTVNKIWGSGASILIPSLIFWLGGTRAGFRAGIITAASGATNLLLKWVVAEPRPFYVRDDFEPLKVTDGYGMPSGNAQGPASMAVALGYRNRTWVWLLGFSLAFVFGLARVYYGVHSAWQVGVGWVLGIVIAALLVWVERPLVDWFRARDSVPTQIALVFIASALFAGFGFAAGLWSQIHRPVPSDWELRFQELVVVFDEDDAEFEFVVPEQSFAAGGVLLGFALSGLVFIHKGWPTLRDWRRRVAAILLGWPTTLAVIAGVSILGKTLSDAGIVGHPISMALYSLIPLHIFVVVPYVATARAWN